MNLYYTPEYWDLYDYQGKRVGKIRRGVEIPGGLYHRSVEIVPTDMKGHILITQRSLGKRKGAGMYEFPAGSVLAGERPSVAALRELREETGLKASRIYPIQTEKSPYDPDESGLIRYTYVAQIDNLLTAPVRLQRGETIDYKIVTLSELQRDYIVCGMFDESRLSFYRNDFFERLEKLIGTPETEEPENEPSLGKPILRFVKSRFRGSASFEHDREIAKEEK